MGGACILSAVEASPVRLKLAAGMERAVLLAKVCPYTDETLSFIRAREKPQQPDSGDLRRRETMPAFCFRPGASLVESLGATTAAGTSTVIDMMVTGLA